MRLDLHKPIESLRRDAVRTVTALSRAAHERHEECGGYDMAHALDISELEGSPFQGVAQASLSRHRFIQDTRRRAIEVINRAPHGAGIDAAIELFHKEIGS